ncbi:MAG TPA: NUDIX domain-containing protein [Ktedonobacterales bacterium]|nr:NUDIX domain-containing protein [Ktedonobacterales bacterium]
MAAMDNQQSGDDPTELFDLIDAQDRVIGRVLRGEAHRDPALLHRSVQVLVFASDGRLLLQRRSPTKDLFPGYYCASASGHVAAGDGYAATAEREVREELGVTLQLTYLDKRLVASQVETEMTALFLSRCDGPFIFHPTETTGGAFFTLAAIRSGRRQQTLPMTPALLCALDVLDELELAGKLASLIAAL